jgi:hypothetical protein
VTTGGVAGSWNRLGATVGGGGGGGSAGFAADLLWCFTGVAEAAGAGVGCLADGAAVAGAGLGCWAGGVAVCAASGSAQPRASNAHPYGNVPRLPTILPYIATSSDTS